MVGGIDAPKGGGTLYAESCQRAKAPLRVNGQKSREMSKITAEGQMAKVTAGGSEAASRNLSKDMSRHSL